MKKIIAAIVILAMFSLPACRGKKDGEVTNMRTETLFYQGGTNLEQVQDYKGSYDFDEDGKKEDISIAVRYIDEDNWASEITYFIGDKSIKVETAGGDINAVYACDIEIEDGIKELAVISTEWSGDPALRIIKYGDNLSLYEFEHYNFWDDTTSVSDLLGTGYIDSPYFEVKGDGAFTLKSQTNSSGMWCVLRDYQINENGVFEEKVKKSYKVLDDYMKNSLFDDELSGREAKMWEQGYIKAYVDYNYGGVALKAGEYFKVLLDSDRDLIYIQKEDGTEGWIDINNEIPERYELNPRYFFLAG